MSKTYKDISKDVSKRVDSILINTNTISIKYDYNTTISYDIFCKSDPILEKLNCVFNFIKEDQAFDVLVEAIATLTTIKNHRKNNRTCISLDNPMGVSKYRKQYVISKIDETKSIDKDIDIINLFKSEFDFDINYDYRDTGYLLTYLTCNKHIYEQPTISREEAYESYINFCDRNYLNNAFNKNIFGKKIKIFCDVIHKAINNQRIKKYYLSRFGKSYLENPEIYYEILKKEEEKNKDPDDIAYSESFDKYFEENRDSYKDFTFTKFEAYEDYKDFCKHNSYEPILKNTFYRFMLNECVVKRSKEKNGSECFILEQYSYRNFPYSYITDGVPEEYSGEVREHLERQVALAKHQLDMVESTINDFITCYQDEFTSFNYTRAEAFELFTSFCETSGKMYVGKQSFYKEMQKYCSERRHRPSPSENPRTYFICRSEDRH